MRPFRGDVVIVFCYVPACDPLSPVRGALLSVNRNRVTSVVRLKGNGAEVSLVVNQPYW